MIPLTDTQRRQELLHLCSNELLDVIGKVSNETVETENAQIIELAAATQVTLWVTSEWKKPIKTLLNAIFSEMRKTHKDIVITGNAYESERKLLINIFDKKNFYLDYKEIA